MWDAVVGTLHGTAAAPISRPPRCEPRNLARPHVRGTGRHGEWRRVRNRGAAHLLSDVQAACNPAASQFAPQTPGSSHPVQRCQQVVLCVRPSTAAYTDDTKQRTSESGRPWLACPRMWQAATAAFDPTCAIRPSTPMWSLWGWDSNQLTAPAGAVADSKSHATSAPSYAGACTAGCTIAGAHAAYHTAPQYSTAPGSQRTPSHSPEQLIGGGWCPTPITPSETFVVSRQADLWHWPRRLFTHSL